VSKGWIAASQLIAPHFEIHRVLGYKGVQLWFKEVHLDTRGFKGAPMGAKWNSRGF
jgi:hypothetical protein